MTTHDTTVALRRRGGKFAAARDRM